MTLPLGFRVCLAPGVDRQRDGGLLIGGSPLTALTLRPRAAAMISDARLTVVDAATATVGDRLLATNLAMPDLSAVPPISPADLTVVIPAHNRADALGRTLSALRSGHTSTATRMVVIDDASSDLGAIKAVCERHYADRIRLDTNRGPAFARNVGLSTTKTPYVAFVDSDVEVSTSDLLALSKHLADPAVALIGPRILGITRDTKNRWFQRYDEVASSLTQGDRPAVVRPGAMVSWLPSACLIGKTESLGTGFDEGLRVGEDVDLVWRLSAEGWRVRYEPDVVAYHQTRGRFLGWLGRKFAYGTSGAQLAMRHGDAIAPATLNPSYAIAAAAVLCRKRWALPIVGIAASSKLLKLRRSLPSQASTATAIGLTSRGLVWAIRQESALVVRHWWPATAIAMAVVPRSRRLAVTALVVDACVLVNERRDLSTFARDLIARRFDDAAYGAGLWWGALSERTLVPLLPHRPGRAG
ncbi:MAG TPA: mycofactocin biosynthesis glycosyltransferase MftF [Marmoricola sp.]|nr:mycofactocin biosynthesis glycosyltransferase MftF [Marmoricola sp.]